MQYAINKFVDHTLLKPTATATDIKNLCKEAIDNDFFAVCVNSCYVELAKKELKNSRVKVCSVVGFPLGAMHTDAKAFEAKLAIDNGADEVDMVINLGLIKRSEEHTSELQSRPHLVCRLLLEKKKKKKIKKSK